MNLSEHLNDEQKKAASHKEGALLVLAGAGSGKTRCLTYRVANLLSGGVPAESVVALTFTNKAAKEMKERILSLTGERVLVSTFHSLGARILRESIHHLGYSRSFAIYDDEDSDKLLKSCIEELGLQEMKIDRKQVKSRISLAKDALQGPDEIEEVRLCKPLPDIYRLYQKRLFEASALDFDDLLYLVVTLFNQHPEVLASYQERWRYFLVDEYQDTNKAQYALVKQLVAKSNNLFAVGDPDQSIYSWRGAEIGNILRFEEDFPAAQVLLLEQNYRSQTNILNAADGLISYNFHRYEKKLWSDLGAGDLIHIFAAYNEREEARFVVEQVTKLLYEGVPLREIAIFYRANYQSRPFEDALYDAAIPFNIVGGVSFYQRREIKDILSLLRITESRNDFIAFARTINLPKRGIGGKTIEQLRSAASEAGISLIDYCRKPTIRLNKKQKAALEEYVQMVDGIYEFSSHHSLESTIAHAVDISGYRTHLELEPDSIDDRLGNLQELANKAAEWEMQQQSPTLSAFLQEITLKTSLDDLGDDHEKLHLMTLHNAKGLEFTAGFIVGLEQDLLPHVKARNSESALEEERRLCYVGMTRAKRHLFLSYCRVRRGWGGEVKRSMASRFLQEIPYIYCQEEVLGDYL